MSYDKKKRHIEYINKIGSPYTDNRYNETITTLEDRVLNLENEIKEQNKQLISINNSFDSSVI